ncbi:signal peptidase [Burkholderia sp. MS389]|uniref:Signal peptidase n=1 Tax=Burkholderia sola TaxID=2843302 RepID=A0ABV2CFN0_9BURK|nr:MULTISPECIES: signal peptidase [unclassified Burkholderia]RQU40966.1 signal peptidase [Burkholderia cenocepacia]MBP0609966.1 signal peptidase [Burkholderia sp. CpTa8-5]MBP0716260.1 signal peptidase [Burkholderia sp. AcTa6-5]OXI76889.1 signal peptidase [Burkholderia sp. AU31280]QRR13898.1 signal peptidase [Burkholderia sp. MS389]
MKHTRHLAGMLVATSLLTGCGTVVRSLPLPAAATAPDTSGVAIYFGAQPHPEVKTSIGPRSESVRVRRVESEQPTCEQALAEALNRLRIYAKHHGGNAVINVTTRFHEKSSNSTTEYTCGVSGSAGAIAVSGDVVQLNAQ